MKVVRTIHPIGQGAFYSEKLNTSDGHIYNIVYDCGSDMRFNISKSGQRIVEEAFSKNDSIDILFLSHFHEDHINGVITLAKSVKIKNIVVPYMNIQDLGYIIAIQKNIRKILGYDFTNIVNPFETFGDSHIIMVSPNEGEKEYTLEQLSDAKTKEILSKSKISLAEWCYRPFNLSVNFDIDGIKKELKNNGIIITNLDWLSNPQKVKTVKSIWENINKKINETSLMLYSFPLNGNDDFYCHHIHPPYSHECLLHSHPYHSICNPSCLYTGDITLKEDVLNLIDQVTNGQVGTFQVPHHGAVGSWDHNALSIGKVDFLSYGINNNYKHPGYQVIQDIMQHKILYCVNESLISMMQQLFIK